MLTDIRTGDDGGYLVSGELTFRGIARQVEDEMTIDIVDDRTLHLAGGRSSTSATSGWNRRAS